MGCNLKMLDSFKQKTQVLVGDATQKVSSSVNQNLDKCRQIFNENYSKIEPIIVNGLLDVAEDKLKDEKFLSDCFEKFYEILPIPVRLVISRSWFTDFLLKRKDPLLEKVSKIKNQRSEEFLISYEKNKNPQNN